jgi:hypothetical protein
MKSLFRFSALLIATSCIQKGKHSSFDSFNRSLNQWTAPEYRRDSHEQTMKENIAVDGASGPSQPAPEGAPGRSGSSSGDDGDKGGVGTRGQEGKNAGSMTARVTYEDESQGRYRIDVKGQTASGAPLSKSVVGSIQEPSFYLLTANGGRGQDGGRGGEGGQGAKGSTARRPMSEHDTTYGGNGGDGGDGGPGGDGGNGGASGDLIVEVIEDQTEILWHVRAESNGGPGGAKGPGGPGGAGGSGGDGLGQVYLGSRTEYDTDAEGNRTSRDVRIYASSYSGSSGSSGRSGSSGSPGRDGPSKAPRIRLLDREGRPTGREFERLFEIQVSDITLSESIPDGVFEPGELVWVSAVGLENVHDMPSPQKATDFALMEDGGISPPNETLKMTFNEGFKGKEKKIVSLEDFRHFFTLMDLTKKEHQDFAAQLDDREATRLSSFRFIPTLTIGPGQMMLSGAKGYSIEPPIYVAQDPKTFRTQYPIVSNSESVSMVPVHVVNLSTQSYGAQSQFRSRLPSLPDLVGPRRVRVELAFLGADEAGRAAEKYLVTEKLGAYLEKDGKRIAETQNLLREPISFEVDAIPPGGVLDLQAGFDVWDDKGLTVGTGFVAEFRVFISPLPGQEPTKLIWTDPIDFLYSAEFRFEADHRLIIFDKQVQCEFPNAGVRKKRIIDRMYIGKSFNKENNNDASNRNWNVQFASAWWFQPRTPLISFDLNEHFGYFDIFSNPERLLYSEEIRDFLNEVYIPEMLAMKDLKPIHAMTKCEYIPSDRWDTLLRKDILFRQFKGHVKLDGARSLLSSSPVSTKEQSK